jgi:hypothetical protein
VSQRSAFPFVLFALFVLLACNLPIFGASPTEIPFSPPSSAGDQDGGAADPSNGGPSSVIETPLPSDTPEPTDVPAPTNTPGLPAGQVLYETEFGGLSGWNSFPWWQSNIKSIAGSDFKIQIATYDAEIRQGRYFFEVPKKYTSIHSFYRADLGSDDVAVTANAITTIDRPWTYISLACRYTETGGWYDFAIQSDGHWYIRKIAYIDGTVYQVTILDTGSSGAINYGYHDAPNRLYASCQGETLSFYVNGVLLGSVEDLTFVHGWVGVGVAAGDAGNSLAEFEDLTVTVP